MSLFSLGIAAVERGLVPDVLTRRAIRRLCVRRLSDCASAGMDTEFTRSLRIGAIAPVPNKANEQHYELPPEFFAAVLGPRRKYSCCYWRDDAASLADAEEDALEITCQRAELADGQEVLELGCGWGSLSLWMAERYPRNRITAVSNSSLQRSFIEGQARRRGLTNLRVMTADMNEFAPPLPARGGFDRIVSVEMFEHLRNYEALLDRIAGWLRHDGRLFVHMFCHRQFAYPFETDGETDWMGRHFFTGGLMPDAGLLRRFDRRLRVARQWTWNGRHYRRTAEAWLANLDRHRRIVLPILAAAYGPREARCWFHRWRTFFLAVAELFGYAGGDEWFVSHCLLAPTGRSTGGGAESPLEWERLPHASEHRSNQAPQTSCHR